MVHHYNLCESFSCLTNPRLLPTPVIYTFINLISQTNREMKTSIIHLVFSPIVLDYMFITNHLRLCMHCQYFLSQAHPHLVSCGCAPGLLKLVCQRLCVCVSICLSNTHLSKHYIQKMNFHLIEDWLSVFVLFTLRSVCLVTKPYEAV